MEPHDAARIRHRPLSGGSVNGRREGRARGVDPQTVGRCRRWQGLLSTLIHTTTYEKLCCMVANLSYGGFPTHYTVITTSVFKGAYMSTFSGQDCVLRP